MDWVPLAWRVTTLKIKYWKNCFEHELVWTVSWPSNRVGCPILALSDIFQVMWLDQVRALCCLKNFLFGLCIYSCMDSNWQMLVLHTHTLLLIYAYICLNVYCWWACRSLGSFSCVKIHALIKARLIFRLFLPVVFMSTLFNVKCKDILNWDVLWKCVQNKQSLCLIRINWWINKHTELIF